MRPAPGRSGCRAAASPVFAHHSWPVDRSRETTVKGTVTAYEWSNPHVMMGLDVKDASGTLAKNIARSYDALNRLQSSSGAGR